MNADTVFVPRNGFRWTLRCACRRLTIVPSVAVLAPVKCLACGGVFVSHELALALHATQPDAWKGYGGSLVPFLSQQAVDELTGAGWSMAG
jgi:hypothetical protein